jgi:hypothetical protein
MQVLWKVWPLGPGQRNKPYEVFRRLCVKTEAIVKREGPLTLASVALGLALLSKEDTDNGTLPSLPHLMVPVDLHKDSSDEGYYLHLALIGWGAT